LKDRRQHTPRPARSQARRCFPAPKNDIEYENTSHALQTRVEMHQVTGSSSVAVLKGEIHNVLALMRANARYSAVWRFTRESPDNKENPLVAGLKSLHESLVNVRDVSDADTVDWLKPFLDIIVTPETSGPITGGALGSLSKFLLYEFVRPEKKGGGVRADEGANRIAFIVCRCRFEATDTDSDEVVSMKIVQVLVDLMRCSAGSLLTDHSVYEICLACLGICSQSRLSELLRRAAEHCLTQVILTVFSRLSCDAVADVQTAPAAEAAPAAESNGKAAPVWDERPESASAFMSEADEVECQDALDKREIWPKSIVFKPPHGVSCMQKILILLCQLTDPSKKDERSRVLGLSLLNVVLETCGSSLSNHPSLVNVMQNTLCKFLLQNSRTSSLSILSLVLRAVFNMFNSVGVHLKVQLEVFFNSMHLALAESLSSPPLIREMALESLIEFCREPQLIIDLYVNYDCAVQSTNLFERLVKFLFKMSEPGSSMNSFNLQAFEGILAILGALCKEIDRQHTQISLSEGSEVLSDDHQLSATDAIRDSRIRKKSLQVAAEAFNKNPKESIRNLQSYGFAQAQEATPDEVAAFLRQAPGLNKTVVGEYLGDHHAFNVAVLTAYAATFSFHNMSLDAALRLFLSGFRLCGEAQKIDRVMEAFSKTMHEHSPGPLKKWDGAFTLAFSLIMLNTDIHSPNVKNKMTKEQFIKNNKGMNAGEDFPKE